MCLSASTYGYWSRGGGDSAQLVFHCMTMSWYAVGTAVTAQPEDTAVGRGMDTNLYSKD